MSWEDCEKKKQAVMCIPEHDEVCLKQHLVEHSKDTENGYQEAFVKMCAKANLCTDKECKRVSKHCEIDCCHSDFCNSAARPTARVTITLLVLFLCILQ